MVISVVLYNTYVQSYFVQSLNFVNSESTLESRDLQLIFAKHIPNLLLSASDNKLERYKLLLLTFLCILHVHAGGTVVIALRILLVPLVH